MRAMLARLQSTLMAWPSGRDWIECALALTLLSALYLCVGFSTGLLRFAPRPMEEVALVAATALVAPALFEELVFRALLIPSRQDAPRALGWIAASTVLFTVWHLVETLYLPNATSIFTRPDFLALAAALGLTCAILRRRSGSLWTAVAVHWLIVVGWLGFFGGPSLAELR